MEAATKNTGASRNTLSRSYVSFSKFFHACFSTSLYLSSRFLGLEGRKLDRLANMKRKGRRMARGMDVLHYRNPGFNQCAVLHTQETIPEQVTFRLRDKIRPEPPTGKLIIIKTDLQTPQAVREIFPQLNVDLRLLNCMSSKPLTRQPLLEFLPKKPPLLLT